MSRIAEMTTSAVTNRAKDGQIKRGGKERTHGHKYVTDDGTENITICDDGICRLDSGTLCGSVRKLNQNLAYAINEEKIDYVTAINAVTINPMKLFNINNKGLIRKGYKADIAIFDNNYEVKEVYVDGKVQQLSL